MKLIKSVVLCSLTVLALACGQKSSDQQREEAAPVQTQDHWHGNSGVGDDVYEDPAHLGTEDLSTQKGTGSAVHSNAGAGAEEGAIYDDAVTIESPKGTGNMKGDDQYMDEDRTNQGTGAGQDDERYLDNTSSEADYNNQDRGRFLGKEPKKDNTSSESDEYPQGEL